MTCTKCEKEIGNVYVCIGREILHPWCDEGEGGEVGRIIADAIDDEILESEVLE